MSVQLEQTEDQTGTAQETFTFQADVIQILDLMVHSLYSNKEIFLRELVSNASDAIDRLRLELLTQSQLPEDEGPLQIKVSYDGENGTITIADNGIGMSRPEVIDNIGTIAKSGTREFLQALTDDRQQDVSMIGQFGVGFYSAFIVADRVTVTTRRLGLSAGEGIRWESDGTGEYTLETVQVPERGTTIVLHLRDGEEDLLNEQRLRTIIKKYSDHISLPILMQQDKAQLAGHDDDEDDGTPPAPQATAVNQASAPWARPKSELSDADYHAFYRHVASDFTDPLAWVHAKVEGRYEYTLLLFIPSRAPYDMWLPQPGNGVKLHVRRVFILDDNGQLMPQYLRFIRGVIDSSDLPLNISRELLQGSRAVDHIRTTSVRRVLKLLGELAGNEPDKYATFWKEFGGILKEGISEDFSNRDEIAKLLRFHSTDSAGDVADVSLSDYVSRMKDGQDHIYYLLAPSLAAASSSPHLEAFRKKGIEVLLLGDDVDNWVLSSLRDFDGKRLQSVTQGSADLSLLEDQDEAKAKAQADTILSGLVSQLKAALAGKAWDVRVASRLTTSPVCIVANEAESESSIAHRLRGSGLPIQPVLEINPQHRLIQRLNRQPADPRLAEWAHVLYDQAVLTLGARIEQPADFVSRLNDLLLALTDETDGIADDEAASAPEEEPGSAPADAASSTDLRASWPASAIAAPPRTRGPRRRGG